LLRRFKTANEVTAIALGNSESATLLYKTLAGITYWFLLRLNLVRFLVHVLCAFPCANAKLVDCWACWNAGLLRPE